MRTDNSLLTKRHLGVVSVDSGTLVIVDPCYLDTYPLHANLDEWVRSRIGQISVGLEHFGGDGCYYVWGYYRGTKLLRVEIDFEE